MMSSEDTWLYRDQPLREELVTTCEKRKLLAMMGTSVEVLRLRRCQHCAEVQVW